MNAARRLCDCLRLNLRVASLAARGRWMAEGAFERGYDRVAPTYDESWQRYLAPTTRRLVERLPVPPEGPILELGCGTGGATAPLAERYPGREIAAVDLSAGMIEQARRRCPGPVFRFEQGDMLRFLESRPPGQAALVVSAWSLGYSRPGRVIALSARALKPGGVFGFVVNRLDTLAPVFRAFRRVMACHPGEVRMAMRPRFPRRWDDLARRIMKAGMVIEWDEEGRVELTPPEGRPRLAWLLETGVLAGFDEALSLRSGGPAARDFEAELEACDEPIRHCYIAAAARRT